MVVFFAQLLNQHQVLVNTWIFKELIFYKVRVFFPSTFHPTSACNVSAEHAYVLSVGRPEQPVRPALPCRGGGGSLREMHKRGRG
jgi:hypothetical protein